MHQPKTDGRDLVAAWNEPLLHRLDWKRLVELVQALTSLSGMELFDTEISEHGGAHILIGANDRSDGPSTILEIGKWNLLRVRVSDLRDLRSRALQSGKLHPIFLTSGSFEESTVEYANDFGIELVDPATLLDTLEQQPYDASMRLFRGATRKGYDIPTCPFCFRPLKMSRVRLMGENNSLHQQVKAMETGKACLHIYEDGISPEQVICKTLTVAYGTEVHFLKGAIAMDMVIEGDVFGELHGLRSITLGPKSKVTGSVEARQMEVKEGAIIDGSTAVREDFYLAKLAAPPESNMWRCPQAHSSRRCAGLLFKPRE